MSGGSLRIFAPIPAQTVCTNHLAVDMTPGHPGRVTRLKGARPALLRLTATIRPTISPPSLSEVVRQGAGEPYS